MYPFKKRKSYINMIVIPKDSAEKRIREFNNSKLALESDVFNNVSFETYTM